MALTDDEQKELLDKVRWLYDQLGPNLWGPDSSLGLTADGQELTVRDGLAKQGRELVELVAAVDKATPPPAPTTSSAAPPRFRLPLNRQPPK